MRNKILMIEDDLSLANPLKDFFEDNGLEVYIATTGEQGLSLYATNKPDLILLDIILPDINGFEIISTIRDNDLSTPTILMTGTEFTQKNQIKAYALGSLNFMPKPIVPQAVLSLIQHILTLPKELRKYKVGPYEIQIHSQSVTINAKKSSLRQKDSILLQFLLERKNQIVPRSTLLKQIWLDDQPKNNNLLDGAILRLRSLFKPYPTIKIKSVYATGYVLESS